MPGWFSLFVGSGVFEDFFCGGDAIGASGRVFSDPLCDGDGPRVVRFSPIPVVTHCFNPFHAFCPTVDPSLLRTFNQVIFEVEI